MRTLLFVLLLTSCATVAQPLVQVERDGVRIVLYTAPCAVTAIRNLPYRAEWIERSGKVYAGCWNLNQFKLFVMYFEDHTAVSIPAQHFVLATGA